MIHKTHQTSLVSIAISIYILQPDPRYRDIVYLMCVYIYGTRLSWQSLLGSSPKLAFTWNLACHQTVYSQMICFMQYIMYIMYICIPLTDPCSIVSPCEFLAFSIYIPIYLPQCELVVAVGFSKVFNADYDIPYISIRESKALQSHTQYICIKQAFNLLWR